MYAMIFCLLTYNYTAQLVSQVFGAAITTSFSILFCMYTAIVLAYSALRSEDRATLALVSRPSLLHDFDCEGRVTNFKNLHKYTYVYVQQGRPGI